MSILLFSSRNYAFSAAQVTFMLSNKTVVSYEKSEITNSYMGVLPRYIPGRTEENHVNHPPK